MLAQSYSAYTLEIQPARVKNLDADDRRARRDRRHPAARPQALPEAARRVEELREPAAAHAAHRRGGRALRRQPLPLPRRRDQGAAVPPVPVRRARLARRRLHRPHQRPRRRAHRRVGRDARTTRAPTTSARSASSSPTSASCTARPASRRSRSTPAAARCARCRARRRCRATTSRCRSTSSCRRSPRTRSATAAARWSRSSPRPATCSRSSRSPASIPTCSSTASIPRTGSCSTSRRTSRCSTGRCAAPIRPARRSSRSWRSSALDVRQAHADADDLRPRLSSSFPARRTASATTSRAATAPSTCTSRSSCPATRTTTCWRARPTSTTPTRFLSQLGLRPQDRHRHRGRAARRAAVARMEAAALRRQGVPRGAPQVVPRRQHLRRHRAGLQRVHADPARARDRDDRQRRRRRSARTS